MFEKIKEAIKQDYYVQNFPNDGQRFVAWYLRNVHLRDQNEAKADITDGADDKQIDAIFVDDDNSTIYVVQGKFVGADTIDAEPLREVLSAWLQLKDLVRLQETANNKLKMKLAEVALALDDDYDVMFELLTTGTLTPSAQDDFATFQAQFAKVDDLPASIHLVSHTLKLQPGKYLSMELAGTRVLLASIPLKDCITFPGIKDGSLFQKNVRQSLGLSNAVNKGIKATIYDNGSDFFFYHNGITAICNQMTLADDSTFKVRGLSVVNGCQSLNTILSCSEKVKTLGNAYVMFRFYEIPQRERADRISVSTNSQSPVKPRDLRSNDKRVLGRRCLSISPQGLTVSRSLRCAWFDGVVPIGTGVMFGQVQFFHLLIRYGQSMLIAFPTHGRLYIPPGVRTRATDAGQHRLQIPQRLGSPVDADRAEQAMFDRIPLGRPGWVVADRHCQSPAVGQLQLHLMLPQPAATTVAPSGIRHQQQLVCFRVRPPAGRSPPPGNRIRGERCRVGRQPEVDPAAIPVGVVQPVGDRQQGGVLAEVVSVDRVCRTGPLATGVLEVTDQLLFLAVHAQDGVAGLGETLPLLGEVLELAIPIRMGGAGEAFAVGMQFIAQVTQQASNGLGTNRIALLLQLLGQETEAAADPALAVHRIASDLSFQQVLQGWEDARDFFPTAGRPAPGRRMRPGGQSFRSATNSRRPRRMDSTFSPVMADNSRSPPCPIFMDSRAANQRRCCSSRRLRSKFKR